MQQEDSSTSRSIAIDSRKLAEASTRDSSSMKAIAVLTMVFLPGTAVAVRAPQKRSEQMLTSKVDNLQHGAFL